MPCSIERLATTLLSATRGEVPADLRPLPGALARRGDASSTLRWLNKPATRDLLASVAEHAAVGTLTHAILDQCGSRQRRHYMRAFLVETGVLPPRDEPLERFETWINELTDRIPPGHAALIRPYAHWAVLRAARRRSQRRPYTHNAADSDRERIREALRLIEHAESLGLQIGELTQPMLDAWTTEKRERAHKIEAFIAWLNKQSLIHGLAVHRPPNAEPCEVGDEDIHTQFVVDLTTNADREIVVRAAGLLALLYGASLIQICQLTTADVITNDEQTMLRLATHPLWLPGAVAHVIEQLADQARANPRARTLDGTAHYLFPGRRPHESMHPHTIGGKLNKIGIDSRITRNRARLTLATDLPAAVVAVQFGYHITTATNWARFAQRDRTEYLIARQEAIAGK